MRHTDFEILTDENRFPVKFRFKHAAAMDGIVEIIITGNWRLALQKAMEKHVTGHMMKCIRFQTNNDYLQKSLNNKELRLNLKVDVMLHFAETMKRELKGHIKLLPVIFEGEFSVDEMPDYLRMVKDKYYGKTDNLYQQARFKYLIQTMYDRADQFFPDGSAQE